MEIVNTQVKYLKNITTYSPGISRKRSIYPHFMFLFLSFDDRTADLEFLLIDYYNKHELYFRREIVFVAENEIICLEFKVGS